MTDNYLIFIVISMVLAIINYGLGLWLMLFAGLLADPIRKLVTGNPYYISIAFVPIFIAVYFKIILSADKGRRVLNYFPRLRTPLKLFFLILFVSALRPIIMNSWTVSFVIYSLVQYSGWLIAITLGFYLVKKDEDIVKFAKIYILTLTPFLLTVLPHFWGLQDTWPVLQTMGFAGKDYLQWHATETLRMINGVFRNPEPMGWHAMTGAISALFILFHERKRLFWKMYSIPFSLLATLCIMLSGRRKFFVGLIMFLVIFLFLTLYKNRKKMIFYATILVIVFSIGSYFVGKSEEVQLYTKSAETGIVSAKEIFYFRGVSSILWAINRDGFFGEGLGATAQGVWHLAEPNYVPAKKSYIEAGSGKIISELGVPGFFVLLILVWAYMKSVYDVSRSDRGTMPVMITTNFLAALVITNLIQFFVSHQIYADPLIGVLTGFILGFLLAIPKINEYART